MGNVSKKGGAFERQVSREFSLWWTEGARDDCVWRTSGSGATHTTRFKKGKATEGQAGDLCAKDDEMMLFFKHFLVECKNGYASQSNPAKAIGALYCIDRTSTATSDPLLIKWWRKAVKECIDSGRRDILMVFKRTGRIPCIALHTRTFRNIEAYAGRCVYNSVAIRYIPEDTARALPISITIIPAELFFDWCSGSAMKAYVYDQYKGNRKG